MQIEPLDRGLVKNEVVLDALYIESRSVISNIYLSSLISDLPRIPLNLLSHI